MGGIATNHDNDPHAVYRMFDAANELLYVGYTWSPEIRFGAHVYTAEWVGEYDHHTLTWYPSKAEAAAAEGKAIKTENPRYNVAGKPTVHLVKPVRITLDLDPEAYTELNRWLGSAGAEVGAPVSKARALRAMIHAMTTNDAVADAILGRLRPGRAEPSS